jgi:hypothetical protein
MRGAWPFVILEKHHARCNFGILNSIQHHWIPSIKEKALVKGKDHTRASGGDFGTG